VVEAEVTRLYVGTTATSDLTGIYQKVEGQDETVLPAAA
jgi:hypothetical protein